MYFNLQKNNSRRYLTTAHISTTTAITLTLLILLLFLPMFQTSAFAQSCPDSAPAITPEPLMADWASEWWMPRHEAKLTESGRETAEVLFIGDSITHEWETTGKAVADNYFSEFSIFNIGFSGDRTENVLWRIQQGELDGINPALAVLMVGTNNTGHRQDPPVCTARGIQMILEEFQERLPEMKVLLLGIFPRGKTPENDLRKLNNSVNQLLKPMSDGERVFYYNINTAFLDENGILPESLMPDGLHPNEEGYRIWAQTMLPLIKEHLD